MVKYFLAFILLASCNLSEEEKNALKSSENYGSCNYYELVNDAVYCKILENKKEIALQKFDSSFNCINIPYYKHVIEALDLSTTLEDYSKSIGYIELLFKLNVPVSEFQSIENIGRVLKSEAGRSIILKKDSINREILDYLDFRALIKVRSLKAKDELLRPYWRDSIVRSIMNETYSKNLDELYSYSRDHGFPGLKLGYYYDDLSTIVAHGLSILDDSLKFEAWNKLLLHEVRMKNLLPSSYSGFIDMHNWRKNNRQKYGSIYINVDGYNKFEPEIKNIIEVDLIRKEIGLRPLWQYALLVGIELPENYSK